ncbi:site-specific integrase [Pseudofrankia sp. BMG5.37]|uniref:tyrosine-type recombinase/integrase n=1 Tax=Pseudofrankia sp. BMG5.37 TaxID=3050035 RepID=UPI0009F42334
MLVRVAADSGARRGELACLRRGDLDGRILTIGRGLSAGELGPTKSKRTRRLTLGQTTNDMINRHFETWTARAGTPNADWIFTASPDRSTFITADALSHRFRRLGRAAGVERAALHRLRHGVATYLVGNGKLLTDVELAGCRLWGFESAATAPEPGLRLGQEGAAGAGKPEPHRRPRTHGTRRRRGSPATSASMVGVRLLEDSTGRAR